jgi:hypothetical protein
MEYCTIPLKTCTKCNRLLPATNGFFHRWKYGVDGLKPICKSCNTAQYQLWRQNNREKVSDTQHQWYIDNRAKVIKRSLQQAESNPEQFAERQRRYRKNHLEEKREHLRRRRTRKRNLPDTFTIEQWVSCLEYFNYCCAVCGKQLRDLLGLIEPHQDHWIALANPDCPGSIATNMVCLCNACNFSKNDTPAAEWLKRKFGKRKAEGVLRKVIAYFEWVRSRNE